MMKCGASSNEIKWDYKIFLLNLFVYANKDLDQNDQQKYADN